ncbi:Hcp family type VI secretion system effector [Burkholderia ubonensis]|uniref:Hcp family type VI secretion system effector n=1 Tax=Burkholderia ubonensis TaxID=101571 RepID=UPI0007557ECF|nr:type VI secretion system tube protein Hcp [Burkholderia ubonensis]KVQ17124.1 Hcp1 family type VI secretion system effector [Burkholderia ubonensis]
MAFDIFLKLGDIKGESRDMTHKDEIQVGSWGWGMSQDGTMHEGTGGGAGKVSVQDLAFTKYVDKSTPNIIRACTRGDHINRAILTVRKAGGENPLEYLKITLTDVVVSMYGLGGAAGTNAADRLTENVSLHFAEFKVEYQPQSAKGEKEGGIVGMTWNIPKNAAS